ncbi:MAG: helix-turn-helix domain-containing protein, partial [Verrucomicrobia bacterium]|nr:helix-turn-helix domain-containing protein [Verrucomicrobiota bacterium]
HPGNRPHWYVSTKVPLFSPGGEVIGIAGAMYAIEQAEEKERYFGALNTAIRYLEQHFSEPISMEAVARLARLSSTHFNRRFQQLLRCTPTEYLRTVRVQTAAKLLSFTQKPLADVAVETGFTDQSHFTRCFHKSTGMTPRDYRLRFQKT